MRERNYQTAENLHFRANVSKNVGLLLSTFKKANLSSLTFHPSKHKTRNTPVLRVKEIPEFFRR